MDCEIDKDSPISLIERIAAAAAILWPMIVFIAIMTLLAGCIGNKASHQNGIVCYVSTSGQLGVGFGECEDLPAGCVFYRTKDVYTATEANWLFGATTNHTITTTFWDTRGMVTNSISNGVSDDSNPR